MKFSKIYLLIADHCFQIYCSVCIVFIVSICVSFLYICLTSETLHYPWIPSSYKLLNPTHWFQFADDAAVITGQESENQYLLNRFAIWCQWSDMIIRVDKCSTFGIKKAFTKSVQYLPKLIRNNSLIPVIEIGKSFCYLGRYFDYEMSDDEQKLELVSLLSSQMKEIYLKPLHPKNKILLYSRYVLPKLSWHLTITSISKTWVAENLDSIFVQYIGKWLELPISGTLSNVYLTSNKFGLDIIPPSTKFIQCQTTIRTTLKSSPNESINHLWKLTKNHTNIQYDQYSATKEVIKSFRDNQENKLTNQLTSQGSFFTSISKFSLPQLNTIWSTCQSKLPKNIFNFTIRYINNSLPTRRNLQKWGLTSSSECSFCLHPESLLHVVTWPLGGTIQSYILSPITYHYNIFKKFTLICHHSLILPLLLVMIIVLIY